MMPFFSTPERIALLQREAESWMGTPFRDGIGPRAKKGVACDCVSFAAAVLQSCGAIGCIPWPRRYVSYTGGPDMLTVLLTTLAGVERLSLIDIAQHHEPMSGDLLVGTTGRARHHIALSLGYNRLLHCWDGRVQEGNVKDTMLVKHLHSIWRAFE